MHVQDRWEGCEPGTPVSGEPLLGYHPRYESCAAGLNLAAFIRPGTMPDGSLISGRLRKVSEALRYRFLRMVGNHSKSAKAEGSLTATPTGGAGTKVGLSDPVVLSGNAIAQRIKATLGITGLSLPRVHIDGVVWHLDVGSSHPGAVVGPKGWAVRPLKRYASWVQNVVRQFGPYPAWA